MSVREQWWDGELPQGEWLTPAVAQSVIDAELARWDESLAGLKRAVVATDVAGGVDFLRCYDQARCQLTQGLSPISVMVSAVGGSQWDEVAARLSNLMAQVLTDLYADDEMYVRFKALSDLELDEASAYLVDRELFYFRLGGIELELPQRQRLAELNLLIADTAVEYQRRVSLMLAKDLVVGERNFATNNFTLQLGLAHLSDPRQRRDLLAASLRRGWGGDSQTDTRELVTRIVDARNERAQLLGFANHAELITEGAVAPSTTAIWELLTEVGERAREAVVCEAERLGELAQADGVGDFNAADWLYYRQRALVAAAGAVDSQVDSSHTLESYFELWTVVERGVFAAARALFGVTVSRREDLPAWDDQIRTYDVYDEDGSYLGVFVADYFARPGKSGGAWMDYLVRGYRGNGFRSVILNCANFEHRDDGPTLLEWDQVVTCFHEFGHALHGFLSRTDYWLSAGTSVPRDFVELPSQLNEMWAYHERILDGYARHWQTGQRLPQSLRMQLLDQLKQPQGYETAEYVASAMLDLTWYGTLDRGGLSVEDFEAQTLAEFGFVGDLIYPRYRSTYFPHAFSVGYDAAYNSYMWAETLVGECEQWLRTEGARGDDGGLNRQAGRRLREVILAPGYSRDPALSIHEFLGRQPSAAAVLRRRGL